MKKITCILLCLIAFASGAAAGFKFSKDKLTKKHEQEIKSIKDSLKDQINWSLKLHGVDTDKKPGAQSANTNGAETKVNKILGDSRDEMLKYTTIKKEHSYDVPKETTSVKKDIYLISEDEYNESTNEYSTLHYYSGDAVLTDDSNNRQSNVKQLIGDLDLETEFKRPGATPSIFVRNEITGEDYEIVLIDERWESIATPAQKAQALNVG